MSSRKRLISVGVCCLGVCVVLLGYLSLVRAVGSAVRRAELVLRMGEASEAREHLAWVLQIWPSHPEARFVVGRAWLADSEFAAAIECLEVVGPDVAEFEDAQQKLAGALLLDGQLERAETVMRRHLGRFPQSVPVRRQLASVLTSQFRTRDAVEILDVSLTNDIGFSTPDRIAMMLDLLTVQFNPPAVEECVTVLQEALARHPEQPVVLLALSRGLLEAGRIVEAAAVLDELPEKDLTDRDTWLTRCRVTLGVGRDQEALVLLESAESVMSKELADNLAANARFHLLASEVVERTGDWQQALEDLNHAAESSPLDRKALVRRARLLQRLGRGAEAEADYEAAHRRASAELAVWHLLGAIQDESPEPEDCLRLAELLQELDHTREAAAWRAAAELVARL